MAPRSHQFNDVKPEDPSVGVPVISPWPWEQLGAKNLGKGHLLDLTRSPLDSGGWSARGGAHGSPSSLIRIFNRNTEPSLDSRNKEWRPSGFVSISLLLPCEWWLCLPNPEG